MWSHKKSLGVLLSDTTLRAEHLGMPCGFMENITRLQPHAEFHC